MSRIAGYRRPVLVRRRQLAPHPLAWVHYCTLGYCNAPGRFGSGFPSFELALSMGLEHLRVWHRPERCDSDACRLAGHAWTDEYGWVHVGVWLPSSRATAWQRAEDARLDALLEPW